MKEYQHKLLKVQRQLCKLFGAGLFLWTCILTVHCCAFENQDIRFKGLVVLHWGTLLLIYVYYKKRLKGKDA